MNDLCIRDLAEIVGGKLQLGSMPPLGGDLEPVGRIVVNCDDVTEGDLFWAVASDDCDGACFADEAFSRGAIGVVAQRHIEPWAGKFSVTVDSTQWALWQLSRWHRQRLSGRLIAITGGTNSLTRQMLAGVLGDHYRGSTAAQPVGDVVSLSQRLLDIDTTDEFALVEMDTSASASLCSMIHLCEPDLAVCNSATGELLARERELLSSLPKQCRAILNGDDEHLRRAAANSRVRIAWAGRGSDCDTIARNVGFRNGLLTFTIGERRFSVAAPGRYCLAAALAAYTVGRAFGIDAAKIAESLSKICGSRKVRDEVPPWRVLDVTGRASAPIIRNGDLFRDYDIEGRRVLVLGDLDVEKNSSNSPCRKLADSVVSISAVDMLVACGCGGLSVAEAAREDGLSADQIIEFADVETTVRNVSSAVAPGDLIVVAGGAKMQRVVEVLVADSSSKTETKQRIADRAAAGVNISEALPLVSVLRETAAALPPG